MTMRHEEPEPDSSARYGKLLPPASPAAPPSGATHGCLTPRAIEGGSARRQKPLQPSAEPITTVGALNPSGTGLRVRLTLAPNRCSRKLRSAGSFSRSQAAQPSASKITIHALPRCASHAAFASRSTGTYSSGSSFVSSPRAAGSSKGKDRVEPTIPKKIAVTPASLKVALPARSAAAARQQPPAAIRHAGHSAEASNIPFTNTACAPPIAATCSAPRK